MSQIGTPLVGLFDLRLVVLSILIAILASYVALDLAVRVTAGRGVVRRAWLVGGAISMGFGIASMHFVGMLAFKLPIPVRYNVPTVLLSLLAAILASAVALYVVSRERFGRREALVGSLMMGGGIAAMHYLGMAAMRFPATCHYNPLLLGLSIVIAVVAALAALSFAFNFHDESRGTWPKATAAVMMGIGIASMHYTGMASASFVTSNLTVDFSHSLSVSWLGLAGIVIVTLITLGFTLLMTFMGHQFAAQALQLQSSEQLVQQSRAVIDAIPQQIWSGPADGTLDFCNERWRSYMGLGLEELQGDGWQRMLHPDDRDRVLVAWQESVANGTPYEQEERHRGANGQYRWFLARGVPLCDAGGRIVRWYGTNTDIEDLKRAEEDRRRGETYLAMAQRMARMGIWSWNSASGVMFGSEEFYHIFGIDPAKTKLTREIFLQSIHPEDRSRYDSEINAAVSERRNWELDYRIVLFDGSSKYIQGIGQPVSSKSGDPLEFVGTVVDITDRKQAEEDLRRLSGQLLRSQDEERRRIARELHDSTGQDLVALATTLGQLGGSISSGDRKSLRLLSECKALADKCIRDVRTLSYVLHPPVLDQAGLGDAIRDYVEGFTKRTGIHLEVELSPRVGRMTRDVELALFRIVQEGLTNIQRHSGSQQATIRIHRNSDLTLEISDLGDGLSAPVPRGKEELRFEVGVGIPSMHERVKLIGGRLEIDSTSHGTTVRVTIPLGGNERETTSHSDR